MNVQDNGVESCFLSNEINYIFVNTTKKTLNVYLLSSLLSVYIFLHVL
jgi:hypothetical protein